MLFAIDGIVMKFRNENYVVLKILRVFFFDEYVREMDNNFISKIKSVKLDLVNFSEKRVYHDNIYIFLGKAEKEHHFRDYKDNKIISMS